MSDLILHHYNMSPFAEKVRLMLGYKGLAWRSVHIPPVLPKPVPEPKPLRWAPTFPLLRGEGQGEVMFTLLVGLPRVPLSCRETIALGLAGEVL